MIFDNTIYSNAADEGAGIRFCFFLGPLPEPDVSGNLVFDNHARFNGGGMCCYRAHPILRDCTFDRNSAPLLGGGAYIDESFTGPTIFEDCIFSASPVGGGLACTGTGTLENSFCDVWGNVGGDYHGCSPGPGTISADPLYCGAELQVDPYEIYEISPCVGAGTNGSDIGARGVGCFSIPDVVFYDNFNDQDDEGWSREMSGSGGIFVDTGQYCHIADQGIGVCRSTVDGLSVENFIYFLDLLPVEGNGWINLIFRYQGSSSFYQIALDGMFGRLEKHTPSGIEPELTVFSCPLVDGIEYEFKIRADAGLVRAWYRWEDTDYIPLFVYADLYDAPGGSIGVGTADSGEQARFDNILIVDAGTAGMPDVGGTSARDLYLGPPAPNPFSSAACFRLGLDRRSTIDARIYDIRGRLVCRLARGLYPPGRHTIRWDGTDARGARASSGVYYLRVVADDRVIIRRVSFLR